MSVLPSTVRRTALVLAALAACAATTVLAQRGDPPTPGSRAPVPTSPSAVDRERPEPAPPDPDAGRAAAGTRSPSPARSFVPSEKVTADTAVRFPVDI